MPEETPAVTPHPYMKYVGVVVLLGIAILGYFLFTLFGVEQNPMVPEQTISEAIRAGDLPRPPVSASTTIKALEKNKGFQALVSYTDKGFEPKQITMKEGDTVRFTNNSSGNLQVMIQDSLPRDSIPPQQFIEITFDTKGSWSYVNVIDGEKEGVVQVK